MRLRAPPRPFLADRSQTLAPLSTVRLARAFGVHRWNREIRQPEDDAAQQSLRRHGCTGGCGCITVRDSDSRWLATTAKDFAERQAPCDTWPNMRQPAYP